MSATPTEPQVQLSVSRTFNAPRELVWKAWTERERLAQWWGPKGYRIEVKELEVRPGGVFHYSMMPPDGSAIWGKFVYGEIAPPERLEFTSCFSDSNGGITRNTWLATWPLEVHNILTLSEHDGKTTLNLRGWPVNATAEELQAFEGGLASMQAGFKGTFDELEAYLKRA